MKNRPAVALSAALAGCFAWATVHAAPSLKTPPCYGTENFATQSALTAMVNAGLIQDFASIYRDEKAPYFLKTALLDSVKLGKYSGKNFPPTDIYRQIQKITVRTKEGQLYEVITVSEASFVECSLSEPAVVVISPVFRALGGGASVLGEKK